MSGEQHKLYPFNRDKLFLSLHKSLGHRGDALESATALTDTVIGLLLRKCAAQDGIITMQELTDFAYRALKRYDILAANTYKAYHQSYLDKR